MAAFEQYIKGLLAEAPAMKLSFLREALRLSPTLVRARIAMWEVYNELGEHQNALTTIRQVPSTHALAREASFLASVSLVQLARYQEAFDALTELNRAGVDGVGAEQPGHRATAAASGHDGTSRRVVLRGCGRR